MEARNNHDIDNHNDNIGIYIDINSNSIIDNAIINNSNNRNINHVIIILLVVIVVIIGILIV